MERNNGVTAIIYLAFVRDRTLQPISGQPTLMPFFTAWQVSPSPKLHMGFKHPFQPGRSSLAIGVLPYGLERNIKGGEGVNTGKIKDRTTDHEFFGYLEICKHGTPKGWDLHYEWVISERISILGVWAAGTFSLDWVHYQSSHHQAQSGVFWCGDRWPPVMCWTLHCSPLPPWQFGSLGGSFYQSCNWKVDFKST